MPEARPAEQRPIVPDPDSSLTRPRRHSYPAPRLWPLKFALLLLLAVLLGVGWLGWQERERLNAELQQLTAEMSNLHARFDADEGRGEYITTLDSRLSAVDEHTDSIVARLAGLEVEVQQRREQENSRFSALDERIDATTTDLQRWLNGVEEREALLQAVRGSLDSLERAGSEGREGLVAQMDALAAAQERHLEHFETLQEEHASLAERHQGVRISLDDRFAALDERFAALAVEREELATADAALEEAVEELQPRLSALNTELRELRQEQLRLSADLEALR